VPVGAEVACRAGFRRLRGTLVDLSPTGCRLFLPETAEQGSALQVQLPGDVSGGSRFALTGKVVRAGGANLEGGSAAEHAVGLRFDPVLAEAKANLVRLLGALASGPTSLAGSGSAFAGKRTPRGLYNEPVYALDAKPGTLVPRDLSRGGIRVEPVSSLAVGQHVRLAIETGGRSEPVIVVARVSRDDGRRGVALQFESIEGDGEKRLEQLVSRLPPVDPRDAAPAAQPLLSKLGTALRRFRS
jgi:hypothetical protein